MRVLLVNSAAPEYKDYSKTYATFPNGMLYIAAVLEKHGHEVQIYDSFIDRRQPEDFVPFNPHIIGLSVLTGPNMDAGIAHSIEFKRLLPGAKMVWGNVHPSILPEQTLSEPYIDYVVIGAGEYTLLELVEHLENGHTNLKEIKGLAYKEDGKIIINEARPFIKNLDELPDPAWHLADVKRYSSITLNTSRGCPFRCTYCYNTAFHRKYRGDFSAERIVAQIEHMQKRYGVKSIRFFEDNFTFNRKRLREFSRLVIDKKLKVKWDCDSRPSMDEEDIALMAKSGCVSVGLGMETGSQRMLDFLQKGITIGEMEKTFWLFVKYKIVPHLYIMHRLPTETTEDFKMTHELLKRLDNPPYMYNRFVPYPGTPLFDYCVANRLITPPQKLGDWTKFTVMSASKVNLSSVPQEMIDEAEAKFGRTYALQRLRFTVRHNPSYFWIILRNPLEFFRAIRSLIKYYLIMSSDSTSSSEDPSTKITPKNKPGAS